jgi:hypothetical protein
MPKAIDVQFALRSLSSRCLIRDATVHILLPLLDRHAIKPCNVQTFVALR